MTAHRLALPTVALGLLASIGLPAAHAQPTPAAAPAAVGKLAYITSAGDVDLVDVNSDGTTTTPQQLGPVTSVSSPDTVKAANLVVCGDGALLAWSEVISKPDPKFGSLETSARIAVRDMSSGRTVTVRSEDYLVGFAGHQLVTVGSHLHRLVMSPSPHLVRVYDGNAYAVAAYPKGVVDVTSTSPSSSKVVERDRLRLTTFGGRHTALHTYDVGTTYRSAAANTDAVSPDGQVLLVELGNHQDFEGLGPSSNFDLYSLRAGHARTQLGHFGTNKADWRLAGATFVGAQNTPWLALHSGYTKTASGYAVRGVVVSYANGQWQRRATNSIAVAGNKAGWVVIQPGRWEPVANSSDGEYTPTPTLDAILEGPQVTATNLQGVSGSEFVWVG